MRSGQIFGSLILAIDGLSANAITQLLSIVLPLTIALVGITTGFNFSTLNNLES